MEQEEKKDTTATEAKQEEPKQEEPKPSEPKEENKTSEDPRSLITKIDNRFKTKVRS